MSAINGDKARFNRRRKQKILRRTRQRLLFGGMVKPATGAKTKEKSA